MPLSKKAIAWGALADLAGSVVLGFITGFVFAFFGLVQNPTDILANPVFLIIGMLAGVAMDTFGGFVAAYRAGYRMRAHALATGVVVWAWALVSGFIPLVFSIVRGTDEITSSNSIMAIGSLIAVIPLAYLGGIIAEKVMPKTAPGAQMPPVQ